MRRQSISELTDDFRIGREFISDLPELIAEDFSFGRQNISELTDDFSCYHRKRYPHSMVDNCV